MSRHRSYLTGIGVSRAITRNCVRLTFPCRRDRDFVALEHIVTEANKALYLPPFRSAYGGRIEHLVSPPTISLRRTRDSAGIAAVWGLGSIRVVEASKKGWTTRSQPDGHPAG